MGREQAARCLQRSWRRSNVGIDCLKKGKESIAELHHGAYMRFVERVKPLLKKNRFSRPRRQRVEIALNAMKSRRTVVQISRSIPLITSYRSNGSHEFTFLSSSADLSSFSCLKDRFCHLTNHAYGEFAAAPKSPPKTKEDLDRLVRTIGLQTDLIPWGNTSDGCFARGQLTMNLLILAGVPFSSISQQCAIVPRAFRSSGLASEWGFHTAPVVRLEDGSMWVIDPTLSPLFALSPENWIDRQKNIFCTASIKNAGDVSGISDVRFSPEKECLLLRISPNQYLNTEGRKSGIILINKLNDFAMKNELEFMAQCRLELEKRVL